MDKNEIKRANRKALPQFMLIMVICFIIGGTIGFCSAKYGLNTLAGGMKTAGMFFGTYIAPWLMLAAAVIVPVVCVPIYQSATNYSPLRTAKMRKCPIRLTRNYPSCFG